MKGKDALFSQKTDVWGTPQWLFNKLNEEFNFTLDPCSNGENSKCDVFFTEEHDGLSKDWSGNTVFMNPPYSNCQGWMKKAYEESIKGCTVVCLVPARTDTDWFCNLALKYGEIRFIRGRLRFGDSKINAPFPSCVVIFGRNIVQKSYHWLSLRSGEPKE